MQCKCQSCDDIGNRKYAGEGGNEFGTGLLYQTYTANSLNQYTQRTVPGAVDVIGTANSNATVTVNLQPTDRHNDYFHAAYRFDNSAVAKYQGLTNVGVLANGTNADIVTTNTGFALLPQTPEIYSHDLDGNLKTNGLWVLTWDAENRLVAIDLAYSFSVLPDAAKRNLRFSYDSLGRRISKTVSNYSGANWHLEYSTKFIYDGWNLLAEINATNNAFIAANMWGLDLSGSMQGADGIGGLLTETSAGDGPHFVAFDGNGNVAALVNGSSGVSSAQYEYGPFAENIRTSGTANARARFSTKYQDVESELYYYGHRYLCGGRWLNRDPIAERGGINTYAFTANRPTVAIDRKGLLTWFNDPTVWATNTTGIGWPLGTDHTYTLEPGELASTIPRLFVSVRCKHVCFKTILGGLFGLFDWRLRDAAVHFHSEVTIAPGLSAGANAFAVGHEPDHVLDFADWARNTGEPLASNIEWRQKKVYYFSESACIQANKDLLRSKLISSLGDAVNASIATWDTSGLHTYIGP